MNDTTSDPKNSPSTQRKETPQKKRPKEELQKRKSQHDSSRKLNDPPTSTTRTTSFEQLLQTAFHQCGVDEECTKKFMSDIAPRGKEVCCTLSQNTDLLKETLKFCGITNPLEQASIITALKRYSPFNSNQSKESKPVNNLNIEYPRLASSIEVTLKENMFGPLTDLIGTWVGTKGWNLIAVPNQKEPEGFILEVVPYFETIVIRPLSTPTPNRGKKIIQEVPTLMYSLSIHSSRDQSLLHRENGTWLLLPDCPSGFQFARQANIPHGTSVIALGKNATVTRGPPVIPDITSRPVIPHPSTFGYLDPYDRSVGPFNISNPNKVLQDDIKGQKIISTTTLNIATTNQGIIGSIPFVTQNANAKKFEASFWIETVENDQGKTYLQLQYSQNTLLAFIRQPQDPDPNNLIQWPHINVNTLVKA